MDAGTAAEIDAVLVRRLEDLGREAGRLAGGAAGGRGGALGAAWAAKRLTTETAVEARSFEPGQAQALLGALRRVLQAEPGAPGPPSQETVLVRGVVGSGAGGANPAYVVALVDTVRGRLSVAAHAKEGLIRQRTAQRAVQQVLASLADG